MVKKLLFSILILLILSPHAWAKVLDIPLHKMARAKSVDLRCVTDEHKVTLSIPERWEVSRATINFSYMNSIGLLKDSSRIVVKLNGYPLKQVYLNPLAPEGSAEVILPTNLIEPGYNSITFSVSQHYAPRCENPCSDNLWTTLKLDQARMKIEYDEKTVPLKLSAISDYLFDPKISPNGEVNLIMQDTSMVSIGGIVSSGIARRFDYKKVIFSVSDDIREGVDNILIGDNVFVEGFLKNRGVNTKPGEGSLLRIMHLPKGNTKLDQSHALIIVSGADKNQIKLAAMTMAIISLPYPDTDEMTPKEFSIPDIAQYGGRSVLLPDKTYDYKTLKFGSQTFRGINPTPADVDFRLPSDFFVKQNMYADLSFSYTYGAKMRGDSVLNVSINGRHIRAIPLDRETGDLIEGYKMTIPTYLFKAGGNTITLSPILTPSVANDCEFIQTQNLFLTILETSSIKFPPMPHLVKLPRLDLFLLNGFPFTRWPDGYESLIYITDKDTRSIASAYNVMGILTQKNGYPLFAMDIVFKEPVGRDVEIFVIGTNDTIPAGIAEITPFNINGETNVPYPVIRSWEDEEQIAYSKQKSALGDDKGIFMQFQSPYKEGRSMMVATATTSAGVYELSKALLDYGVQGNIKGDVALIGLTPPDYSIYSLNVGKSFFTGKSGDISKIDFYLHSYPYIYYAALAATILIITFAAFYFLKRRWKKRMGHEKNKVD
ncbi:MAG: cellulose biosynthesis cyclic di-GMP-binding regulatory protein BcsB [bacterium]|nr:cellulose biosynthesis cyclic di-GMP-binding regulatory protein BcsB [bacterium]